MNATKTFKQTIQDYLEKRAAADELFAITFKKEGKNIDDCISYILNTVKESGSNGFADDEIFGMAVHYYDENEIKIGSKAINAKVVVNHRVDLPAEEVEKVRQEAREKIMAEEMDRLRKKPVQKKLEIQKTEQPSLF